MKLYIVGTSCTWFARNNTSYIIDDKILFDLPEGSYKTILKQIDITKVEAVFISHFHSDHFNDLHILATRWMRETKTFTHKLKVFCPKGTLEQLINLNKVMYAGLDECLEKALTRNIDFIEVVDGDTFDICGYKVKVYKVDHGKVYCQGYTFTDNTGKTVAFSADTTACESLEKMLSFSDFAFVDMAATKKHASHLSFDEFVDYTKKYKSCKMFPIHTSDETQELAEKAGLNYVHDGELLNL